MLVCLGRFADVLGGGAVLIDVCGGVVVLVLVMVVLVVLVVRIRWWYRDGCACGDCAGGVVGVLMLAGMLVM